MKNRFVFEGGGIGNADASLSIVVSGSEIPVETSGAGDGGTGTDLGGGGDSDGLELAIGTSTDIGSRPFLTTPFDDYTVTEGFLFVIALVLVIGAIFSLFRGR